MWRVLPFLLLAACAAPLPPALPAPLSYPPLARERLLRFALAEWREGGCVTTGLPAAVVMPGCAGVALREGEAAGFPRILAYWRAVPDAPAAIPDNRGRYAAALQGEGAGLWAEPFWSAAFISWLFAAAGVDAAEFRPSASHAHYLDHLDALAAAWPETAPFIAEDPQAYAPRAGDLVCRDRSARPLARWAERAAEAGRFRPMHCDLVVEVAPGVVGAIGGNVGDAVTLSRWEADAGGRLIGRFLVVMRSRLGELPPWAVTPAGSWPAAAAPPHVRSRGG